MPLSVSLLSILVHDRLSNYEQIIDKVSCSQDNITQIISKINSNKWHGWDNTSARMIKICDKSVSYPLKVMFQTSFQEGMLPESRKKANISLFPVFAKTFDQLIFNDLFHHFVTNELCTIVSLVSYLVIPVFSNYCLLYMR